MIFLSDLVTKEPEREELVVEINGRATAHHVGGTNGAQHKATNRKT